ncbi:VOC family protein [Variovorax guangxiensis]|uniref:VOC family protein n=1 Tax=Variovorax guangxiensis TaxID=1775474 RepID=UPI00285DD771|nr:VOC family protein [Variovorax guangxiensis]MDR6861544.1 catechol 2,3-dioxygenase-like lactoylglutathione lyase family enzyme [Variovorax guangxiensis]
MMIEPVTGFLPSSLGKRMQLGFVVKDLASALTFWTEEMKVGPFVVMEESIGDRKFVHRGQVSDVQMSVALSYLGDTQIEVITQANLAPSPYTEFFASGRQGLHHLAFYPEDYEQACRDLGHSKFKEVMALYTSDGAKNVSYFESPPYLGLMIELVPLTAMRQTYYGAIKRLAEKWDGGRPVRRFRTRADFLASEDCRA